MADEEVVRRYEAELRHRDSLLQAERKLREVAEKEAAACRKVLEEIAENFCGEELDARLKESRREIEAWRSGDFRDFLLPLLRRKVLRGEEAEEVASLEEEVRRLREELEAERQKRLEAEASLRALEGEVAALKRAGVPAAAAAPEPAAVRIPRTAASLPDTAPELVVARAEQAAKQLGEWFEKWHSSPQFERDVDLLRLLGSTGASRRPQILEVLARQWGISPSAGSLKRLLSRTAKLGLIETFQPGTDYAGQAAQLIRLTEKGKRTYQALFGRPPAPSELDKLLKQHGGEEQALSHASLTLAAVRMLEERLGAKVTVNPEPIRLPQGRVFEPDLAAEVDGGVLYIECERATGKPESRLAKWQNAYEAGGGEINVICPDKKTRDRVVSEINSWAGLRPLTLRVSDISTLQVRKDKFWFYERVRR